MKEQTQYNSNPASGSAARRPMGPGQPVGTADALTPKDIASILRRHVVLIFVVTILGISMGVGGWFLLRIYAPEYTAMTYIRVLPAGEKDPMSIGGSTLQKDILYEQRFGVATLMKSENYLMDLLKSDKVRDTKWFERFGSSTEEAIPKALKKLKKRLGASAMRDADFVTVSMRCRQKSEAKIIVDEMVRLFISARRTREEGDVGERLVSLNSQKNQIEKEIADIDSLISRARTEAKVDDLAARNYRDTIEIRLDNLQIQKSNTELQVREYEAIIKNLRVQTEGSIEDQVQVRQMIETDQSMVVLTQRLSFLKSELEGRLSKFGENHREVRQLREQIQKSEEEKQIRRKEIAEQTRQANLRNAEDSFVVLNNRMEELNSLYESSLMEKQYLDRARVQYEEQTRRKDEAKARLEEIRSTIDKLQIIRGDTQSIAKLVSMGEAPLPKEMSFPKAMVFFPGGTMLGLMLGIGLAFLIELLNDLVRTPRDVMRYLHIPLLGVIPDESEDDEAEGADLCQIVRALPNCIISESYKSFKTNLSLSGDETAKVLFVTSGMAGDGKTSVAINLALSFAADKKKVLLIDANFWRPTLHNVFPNKASRDEFDEASDSGGGLSDFLAGGCDAERIIRPSGAKAFDIVDSGPMPANPTELFGNVRMSQLIDSCRKLYDYVLIDGPPVLLVSDAKILCKQSDGTVLVFNAQATRRGAAQRTIRELRDINAAISGCVLFSVKSLKGGYFQEQFRYYQDYQKLQLARAT